MTYDKDSFLAGIVVGRALWRPYSSEDVSGEFKLLAVVGDSVNRSLTVYFDAVGAATGKTCVINWGDGQTTTINGGTLFSVSHTYASAGQYIIRFTGLYRLKMSDTYTTYKDKAIRSVLTPFPSSATEISCAFCKCTALESIPENLFFKNGKYLTSISGMFFGCTALASIPPKLLRPCKNVTNIVQLFSQCSSVLSIPDGLLDYNTKITTAQTAFQVMSSLQYVPSTLFDACPLISDFQSTFWRDTAIVSAVPELWVSHPNAASSQCFFSCTRAANYSSIPASWK